MAVTNGTSNSTSNGTASSTTNETPTHTPITSPEEKAPLPIVIAGGGCVGLFLALLLSHTSPPLPNPIIVIEPQTPDPTSTRAMAHQPPTYPILSQVPGLLEELISAGSLSSGLCFRTSVAKGNKVIAEKKFGNSGKGQLLLPQGKFQEILMKRLSERPGTKIHIGSSVTGFSTNPPSSSSTTSKTTSGSVTVHSHSITKSQSQDIEAAYLIDASGAHSTIRKSLALALEGETLDSTLVATDIHFPFSAHSFHDANFIIDPTDYGLIGRILPATNTTPALWRVSYGIPGAPSTAEIEEGVHEKLARMLPNDGKNGDGERGYEVVRIAPYKAHQRLSSTMYARDQKVVLIGDAAHLTNPYAGLGLASGIADASSLAPVLARILLNQSTNPDALLQSWSDARRNKFLSVVDKPSRMSYMRVRSDVSTEEKVGGLLARDPLVRALKEGGMPVMPPSLETKGEELEGW
ncbi:monooxygenase [Paraphoma chrysanthemicola]|nr:monooxygenase [Paraphoma chrysanthemicola]